MCIYIYMYTHTHVYIYSKGRSPPLLSLLLYLSVYLFPYLFPSSSFLFTSSSLVPRPSSLLSLSSCSPCLYESLLPPSANPPSHISRPRRASIITTFNMSRITPPVHKFSHAIRSMASSPLRPSALHERAWHTSQYLPRKVADLNTTGSKSEVIHHFLSPTPLLTYKTNSLSTVSQPTILVPASSIPPAATAPLP